MKILGLDLGASSIGWALIDVNDNTFEPIDIIGMGSRIVSFSVEETNAFTQSSKPTVNAMRTVARTARKMNKRGKQRRKALQNLLHSLGLFDRNEPLNDLPPLELWRLRAMAADSGNKLSLRDLGRVILHLSKKRGYRHSRQSSDSESKDTKYVAAINERYARLVDSGQTMGQWLYVILKESEVRQTGSTGSVVTARLKEGDPTGSHLLPRIAHEQELMAILRAQQKHYTDLLTDDVIKQIFDTIFHQRPLKSCKHLVSRDEMFSFRFTDDRGREVNASPRVAPKSSPIAQLTRIWETVNNLRLVNLRNKVVGSGIDSLFPDEISFEYRRSREVFELNLEEKKRVVDYLMVNEKLTATKLKELLNLKKTDGFKPVSNITTGIKGNKTYVELYKALEGLKNRDALMRFNVKIIERVNSATGEITNAVSPEIIKEPLYMLWHAVYSISDAEELKQTLRNQFGITDEEVLERLSRLDFTTAGFSNRSAKFMRYILPYLMEGNDYATSCAKAGFRHSDYVTKEENEQRVLEKRLPQIRKGELRQPNVEKVLNQMVNVVNSVVEAYGPIDEIRVELARELKQTKDQRIQATVDISKNEKTNKANGGKIAEHGLPVTRRNLQKYKLWEETGHQCIYCNSTVNIVSFLSSELSEVEHIIPRSLYFDDSMSNKTCSCSHCNRTKGQMTAYDFMKSKGDQELLDFQKRVEDLADSKKISRTKLRYFMTPGSEIPQDFVNRDLQETRFISRKATEMLRRICRNVNVSSGKITDFFRNAWGYNSILETINFERYDKAEQTERSGSKSFIRGWAKRMDHRHHAVDALTVALTRQGYIQKLNTLSASRDEMRGDLKQFVSSSSLLEQWASSRPHFAPSVVVKKLEQTGVSFKSGKKATTPGHFAGRTGRSLVPRGPMHESTIYGEIYLPAPAIPINKALKKPEMIADEKIRVRVEELLHQNDNDPKKAAKHLKKNPLLDSRGNVIESVATRRRDFTKRVKVESLNEKQIEKVVDSAVRRAIRQRFDECGSEKAFQQSFAERPLYLSPESPAAIKRVTITTGLKPESMVAVKHIDGTPVSYAKTGNNHHLALYRTADGSIIENVTSLWIAVKRRNLGLPAVISDVESAWRFIEEHPGHIDLEEVASSLPPMGSTLVMSLAANEMVLIGLSDEAIGDSIASGNYAALSAHLYRVQRLTDGIYHFRHHSDTSTNEDITAFAVGNVVRISSLGKMHELNVRKVRVDALGRIILR